MAANERLYHAFAEGSGERLVLASCQWALQPCKAVPRRRRYEISWMKKLEPLLSCRYAGRRVSSNMPGPWSAEVIHPGGQCLSGALQFQTWMRILGSRSCLVSYLKSMQRPTHCRPSGAASLPRVPPMPDLNRFTSGGLESGLLKCDGRFRATAE